MYNLTEIFISIGKGHLIALVIVVLSYIIESSTSLKLFFDNYQWKKSLRNAEDSSNRDSGIYLVILISVFIYDILNDNIEFKFVNVLIWLILIIILTKLFYRIHKKYQKFDPNKADDDFT